MTELSSGDKHLIHKIIRLEEENSILLETVMEYRAWFIANYDILQKTRTTAPPYRENEIKRIVELIHAKYCTNCLLEE